MTLTAAAFTNVIHINPSETEFTFRLLPSSEDYLLTSAWTFDPRTTSTRLGQLKITIQGEGATPDSVRLVNRTPLINNRFPFRDPVIDLGLEKEGSPGQVPVTAELLVVQNLLIDGGWSWKMTLIGAPALGMGYKNSPLNLQAKAGAIRNLIVREFGSIGMAPWSHVHGISGMETFPVVVGGYDMGQVPPSGFRRPWEVLNCEIHGFNGVYAGYTTMMMVHAKMAGYTPTWVINDVERRFAHVGNVQYRSAGDGAFQIAMGNAGGSWGSPQSGRTTFRDNVVLNVSLGYNGDTGILRSVDILNSLGLNVWWWANFRNRVGNWHTDIRIADNSIRLGPRASYPNFRTFCWSAPSVAYTDPSLQIGRSEVNDIFVGIQVGTMNRLRVENNFLTTIPAAHFDESGSSGPSPQFRLLRRLPSVTAPSCINNPESFVSGTDLTLGNNYASGAAQDFFQFGQTLLAQPGAYPTFSDTVPSDAQNPRPVLTDMYVGTPFNFGRITRVIPVTHPVITTNRWKTSPTTEGSVAFVNQNLVGSWEVSLGQPLTGASSVTIPARLMLQKTALADSVWGEGKRIWLEATGLVTWNGHALCDSIGETSFTIPVNTSLNGEVFIRAYHDPVASTGAAGQFSEYKVAHAHGIIPIGKVVSVRPSVPIAIDRRETGVQEGRLLFRRTGNLASTLTVNFNLGGAGSVRPATPGTDFTLHPVGNATLGGSGLSRTLTFPTNSATAEIRVIPLADQVIENEFVWVTVASGVGYAVSSRESSTGIYIYDGPPWTLHEITHSNDPFTGVTRAQAVSGHLSGNTPVPVIAADMWVWRTGPNSPGGYTITSAGYVGAQWNGTFSAPSFPFENAIVPPHAPVATGINDLAQHSLSGYLTQPSGQDRAVKMWVGPVPGYLASWSYLPIPTGGSWLTGKNRALCISPNGTYIGGYATRTQVSPALEEQTAVFWLTSGMTSLFTEALLDAGRVGEALAVNNSGEFVGRRTMPNPAGSYIPRGFRSKLAGTSVTPGEFLIPPLQAGVTDPSEVPSTAIAIGERSGNKSGLAAGWAGRKIGQSFREQPAVWWHRSDGGAEPANAERLLTPLDEVQTGRVNAIARGEALLGWIGDANGANRKAWYWPNGWTPGYSLDDKFLVFGFSTAWSLNEFTDASDKDAIVGNGLNNGSARGFLLLPQTIQP